MTQDSSVPGDTTRTDTGSPAQPSTTTRRPRPSNGSIGRFILALLPFVGMLVLIPWANRTDPFVFGLPFLLFWVVIWVVFTSACMTVVYFTDPANKPGSGQ
jgi:hypothetical protein